MTKISSIMLLLLAGSLLLVSACSADDQGAVNSSAGLKSECTGPGGACIIADFIASPTTGTAPFKVEFMDTSTGYPTSWHWDFGDGTSASGMAQPSHTYEKPGFYTVTLTAGSLSGGTDTRIRTEYIAVMDKNKLQADFLANPTNGDAPLTVRFTDCSVGIVETWHWDFGDGITGNTAAPIHTYAKPGKYTVILTVSSRTAGTSTKVKENYILVEPTCVIDAHFNADPSSGPAPLTVTFSDCSIGNPTMWSWDFGDGTVTPMAEVESSCTGDGCHGSVVKHTYTTPGTYTVTMTAGSRYCAPGTATRTITVTGPSVKIHADFTGVPTSGQAPLSVKFTDCSTGGPTMWSWDFGDGTSEGMLANPTHTYMKPGVYTVTLTASNQYGGSDKKVKAGYIRVEKACEPINADFTGVPTSGQAPLAVQFTDRSTGVPTMWYWDFGDGTNEIIANPAHTYTQPGTYTVTLTASNQFGATDTEMKKGYITVGDQCQITARFDAVPESGPAPLTVQFTDRSLGNPTMWHWDFGDGVIPMDAGEVDASCVGGACPPSMIANPVHTYTKPGTYTVTLTASSQTCAPGTFSKTITVGDQCQITAQFDAVPEKGEAPLMVQFTDRSLGNPTMWHWDFGDGVIPMDADEANASCVEGSCWNIANPVHIYREPGFYSVTLTASSQTCAPGTATRVIEVLGGPVGEGIPISAGWNFVSVPKKLAPGSDTASIFKKIDAGGHSMFQYDAVRHIWTTMTVSSPVRPLEGYWIYSTKADTVPLTYDTNPVQTPPTIEVKKGWNAIGFTGMTPIEAKYTLLSVENKWVNCVGFNAGSQQYEQMIIKGSNDQTLMKPFMGYWLYMSGDGILAANAA